MLGSEKKIDDVVENYKFVSPESIEEAVQVVVDSIKRSFTRLFLGT